MSAKTDWLPDHHESLYNQANCTTNYLTSENLARFGITGVLLAWYYDEYISRHNAFNAAFEDWNNPAERTMAKTATLVSSKKLFKESYRQLYIGYLKGNRFVTDADLIEMGMPKRASGVKAPSPQPTTLVEATVDTSIPATVGVNFRNKNAKSIAKPKGMRGVELIWEILDSPPADWSKLTHSVSDTRTPMQLVFTGKQRGKTLYFSMRWENKIGEKGPWNDIAGVIIP
jgi:hypothetical protein